MFPMIGLFVFSIPAAGLVIGMGLLFIRRTRSLAPFAFLVPLLGGVGAVTGLFALEMATERMGVPWWLVALATWGGWFGGERWEASLASASALVCSGVCSGVCPGCCGASPAN